MKNKQLSQGQGTASPNNPQFSILNSQLIICVTGPMASGKNYICSQLEDENCVSIDLDKTVHKAIELCTSEILAAFEKDALEAGIELKNSDGSLNRRSLGQLIFPEPELLAKQESIVYPKTVELVKEFIAANKGKSIILNATVLYKTPELMDMCDEVYFVKAGFFKRLIRARCRDKMPFCQILRRFKAQKNLLREYKLTGKPILIISN